MLTLFWRWPSGLTEERKIEESFPRPAGCQFIQMPCKVLNKQDSVPRHGHVIFLGFSWVQEKNI